MAELPPFGPGRAPRDLTYDSAPPRVAIPLLVLRRRHLLQNFRGFLTLAIVLGAVLESGACLRLAAPNPVASLFGLAGPSDAGDVPVQAPGPGRLQHRALAGAQGALQLVQCWDGTHRIN